MRYIPNTACVRVCVSEIPATSLRYSRISYVRVFLCPVCACVAIVLTMKHISVGNNCASLVQLLAVHQY